MRRSCRRAAAVESVKAAAARRHLGRGEVEHGRVGQALEAAGEEAAVGLREGEGDFGARREVRDFVGVFEEEVHPHRVHEAGDGLVRDAGGLALEHGAVVDAAHGPRLGGAARLWRVAATGRERASGEQDAGGEEEGEGSHHEGRERGGSRRLDERPLRLVLGREHELPAEGVGGFVRGEAGRVGGDLEEHAARLAGVDRVEVLAVDGGRGPEADLQQKIAHLHLGLVVGHAEGDVVDGPRAHPPGLGRLAEDVDEPGAVGVRVHEPEAAVLLAVRLVAHRAGQDAERGVGPGRLQRDRVEGAECGLWRDAPLGPAARGVGALDDLDDEAVRRAQREHGLAEALAWRVEVDARQRPVAREAVQPQVDRADGRGVGRRRRLRDPDAAGQRALAPGEEGEHGARPGVGVGEVEVVGAGVVEVHRPLDEAEPEEPCEHVHGLLRRARDGRDVVKPGDRRRHREVRQKDGIGRRSGFVPGGLWRRSERARRPDGGARASSNERPG